MTEDKRARQVDPKIINQLAEKAKHIGTIRSARGGAIARYGEKANEALDYSTYLISDLVNERSVALGKGWSHMTTLIQETEVFDKEIFDKVGFWLPRLLTTKLVRLMIYLAAFAPDIFRESDEAVLGLMREIDYTQAIPNDIDGIKNLRLRNVYLVL